MNEDFVPYELAVKLKEKGFPQRPDYFNYSSYYDWDGLRKIHSLSNASVWFDPNISRDNIYFAPTISQVLKWLREKKKIHIIVEISDSGWYYTYYPNIRWKDGKLKNDKYFMSFKHHSSYELAALAGIEYYLDNLI